MTASRLVSALRRHRGIALSVAVILGGSLAEALAQSAAPAAAKASSSLSAKTAVHGLDPADMDTTAKACQSFYQFADGGWLKRNSIPPEYPAWGTFSELLERNRQAMREILEKLAR